MTEHDETLGPYTLLRKIGAGGMGEVHLARDPRLDREVALKVLPDDLRSDPERRQRFLREARAAAKLSHPHITAIHEVGEADGRDYIAFENVEGKTLDALVHERRLTLVELIDLALPLADAIAYAHERGVIHRDLKTSNVVVTSRGHAKLLDFGLAKLLDEGANEKKKKSTTLTIEGAIFGTPQAMSPEQALGRSVDERSDVFSFGSLLYEMAAGHSAFDGETVMEVMDAVIHAEPADLSRVREDLPPEFAAIVAKAMRKDPAERYPSITGLVADLRHFKRKTESGLVPVARERRSLLPLLLLAGAVIAIGLVWSMSRSADPDDVTPGSAPIAVAPESIAVMGFEWIGQTGANSTSVNLDRALTSLVTTALAESGGIDVASSSKVVAALRRAGSTPGAAFDPGIAAEAARDAEVELMLVGQVLTRGSGLILTAELVDVASGNALDSMRREVASEEDLFALAEGLAADVRARLGLTAASAAGVDLERELTDSTEAYFKFVAGEMALNESRFVDARRLFAQAIEIDPSFAYAHIRLGIANEWEGKPEAAIAAYNGALAHSDRLPERWQRLVQIVLDYNRGELDRAFADVQRLIDEGHRMPEAYNTLGELLTHSSRHEDVRRARSAFLQALDIDPNFQIVLFHVGYHSNTLGDLATLETLLERLRREGANPEGVAYLGLMLDAGRRDYAAVAARIEAAGRTGDDYGEYAWSLIELGRLDDAGALFARQSPDEGSNMLRNKLAGQAGVAFRQGHIRDALELYRTASEAISVPEDRPAVWYAANLATAKCAAAHSALLLGLTDEGMALVDEGIRIDPYGLELRFWKVRWLVDAGRIDDAAREVDETRTRAAQATSPIARAWLALAETEVALAQGDVARAQQRLAMLDDTPRGARPWTETELVRARVARAAGDAPAEVEAWRTARYAARDISELFPDLAVVTLYGLADAEDRAGMTDAAREHGRAFVEAWSASADDVAILEDARRRWGD